MQSRCGRVRFTTRYHKGSRIHGLAFLRNIQTSSRKNLG